ncbi:hypothetical protein [uncultured Ruegeria sp.]|uniref:hypothetical protein n=1 Tax=uncultured Ruegeria sp. TaxID=259304 RepID=UPI00261F01F6|nr:hypothetical protein [uncultured Ruegeria sp.]
MQQNELIADETSSIPPSKQVGWFEESIPIRGCKLSLVDIKNIYEELSAINRAYGETIVATLPKNPEMSDAEWEQHVGYLLQDAFCLTVSIRGERDQQLYGEDAQVFTSDSLPNPIKSIYFNNITAWRRNANNTDPQNRIEVFLDFSKPALFDPSSLVSEPTPNASEVTVRADDMMYFRAVRQVIDTKLMTQRTWYGAIHRSFAYDVGMWTIALPAGLILATHYMELWLPSEGNLAAYRWAFFLYSVGLVLIGYRFLNSYVKWAFPVNLLSDNQDKALRHRLALGAIFVWLAYKAADAIYELLPLAT